jgi:hypothetical protein
LLWATYISGGLGVMICIFILQVASMPDLSVRLFPTEASAESAVVTLKFGAIAAVAAVMTGVGHWIIRGKWA